jgi:hypothetical protein
MKGNEMEDKVLGVIKFTDFSLAATLICLDQKLYTVEINPANDKKSNFVFKKNETIERLISGYWNGNLLVEPKHFSSVCREIKSRARSDN